MKIDRVFLGLRRPGLVAVPAVVVSAALIASGAPAQAASVENPAVGSSEFGVTGAPALRAGTTPQAKVTLSKSQQITLTGHLQQTNRATIESQGLPARIAGSQTEYLIGQTPYPYFVIATGTMTGSNYKGTKKFLKTANNITSVKFNDRKQTGTVRTSVTETKISTLSDGTTIPVTGTISITFRLQGKKIAYAAVASFQTFGGSKAGSKSRADKAADIIAKKNGVRV